ncbi:MAG: hypothetical protein Q4B54_14180, partial [Coriobacteriales bacterium]|nr:hypothetical protein [Coriobacteriales bacterium]
MKRVFATTATCCALALALGLVACGGSQSTVEASDSASATSASSTSSASSASTDSGSAATEAIAAGYLDENNVMTAKALVELDGAGLTTLAESAGYKCSDKHAQWFGVAGQVAPTKGLTSEEMAASESLEAFNFTKDEIPGLAIGGKGTPIKWLVSTNAKYADASALFAAQQVSVVDQCEVDHRNYGKQIWAIVENSAGDRFLLCTYCYESDGTGSINLFNSDYLATNANGIASEFNLGTYLLEDAHTIDAA